MCVHTRKLPRKPAGRPHHRCATPPHAPRFRPHQPLHSAARPHHPLQDHRGLEPAFKRRHSEDWYDPAGIILQQQAMPHRLELFLGAIALTSMMHTRCSTERPNTVQFITPNDDSAISGQISTGQLLLLKLSVTRKLWDNQATNLQRHFDWNRNQVTEYTRTKTIGIVLSSATREIRTLYWRNKRGSRVQEHAFMIQLKFSFSWLLPVFFPSVLTLHSLSNNGSN